MVEVCAAEEKGGGVLADEIAGGAGVDSCAGTSGTRFECLDAGWQAVGRLQGPLGGSGVGGGGGSERARVAGSRARSTAGREYEKRGAAGAAARAKNRRASTGRRGHRVSREQSSGRTRESAAGPWLGWKVTH